MEQKQSKTRKMQDDDSNGEVLNTQEGNHRVIQGRAQGETENLQFTHALVVVTIMEAPSVTTFELEAVNLD